jgi:hypothetical protein
MTWREAIDTFRAIFGVDTSSSDSASTGISRWGSEPNSVAATSIDRSRSVPNHAALEPHQAMPVRTARGDNQHQAVRVHLSTNKPQEKEEESAPVCASNDAAAQTKPYANHDGDRAHQPRQQPSLEPTTAQPVTDQPQASSAREPDLPTWAIEMQKAADMRPYLDAADGCLPPDVIAKFREASDKGLAAGLAEIARKLSAFRTLGLDDEQIRDAVIAARDYVLESWSRRRVEGGKMTEDEADCVAATSMAPGAFVRALGAPLSKRLEWARRDIVSGKLVPSAKMQHSNPSNQREREVGALQEWATCGVASTNASNADLGQRVSGVSTDQFGLNGSGEQLARQHAELSGNFGDPIIARRRIDWALAEASKCLPGDPVGRLVAAIEDMRIRRGRGEDICDPLTLLFGYMRRVNPERAAKLGRQLQAQHSGSIDLATKSAEELADEVLARNGVPGDATKRAELIQHFNKAKGAGNA